MNKIKLLSTALAAVVASCFCATSVRAEGDWADDAKPVRYSTDGGSTWAEYVDTFQLAMTAVSAESAAVIEIKSDVSLLDSAYSTTGNITIRTWPGSATTCSLNRTNSDAGRKWNINGGSVVLSDITVSAGPNYIIGLFQIASGAALYLQTGTTVTSGAAGGNNYAVNLKGELHIDGGVITGWNMGDSPLIYPSDSNAKIYITAGGICNCTQSGRSSGHPIVLGGDQYSGTGTILTMTGGYIKNNQQTGSSSTSGGVIYFYSSTPKIVLSGGEISGNSSVSGYCAAICRANVYLSGNPVVTNNTNAGTVMNIFHSSNGSKSCNVYVEGNLTAGANVGIYSDYKYSLNDTFGSATETSWTGTEYIHNDRNAIYVGYIGGSSGKSLKWKEKTVDKVSLTIPAKTGLAAPTVTSSMGTPEETSSGVWSVAANSTVTLTYTAATGYRITGGNPVEVAMGTEDKTLTTDELPTVQQQVLFTIPARAGLVFESIAGGNPTTVTEGSQYYVDPNSSLTITFTAASGYQLTAGGSVVYSIGTSAAELDTFPAVQKLVIAPSVGTVAAVASGWSAKITLNDVVKGTDDKTVDATSYSVWYKLGDEAAVEVLKNQTATSAEFTIENLDEGDYACKVWIVTNLARTSDETSVDFTVIGAQYGWTVSPMTVSGDSVRNDGTTVGAYSIQGGTVNGVAFSSARPVTSKISVDIAPVNSRYGDYSSESVSGDYGQMLSHASYWNSGSAIALTFSGLVSNRVYLIQFVSHNGSGSDITISAEGTSPQHICKVEEDETYRYGASLVGIFKAVAETKTATITFTGLSDSTGKAGEGVLNAIQIRDLGEAHVPTVTLTVPEKEGLRTPTVTCTVGTPTTAGAGMWKVAQNSTVTLTYEAKAGYKITDEDTVEVAIGTENVTLTTDQLPTVEAAVADPVIGSVAASVNGATATITLSDVEKGTDDHGTAATAYSVWYKLGSAADVEKLTGQTAASVAFSLESLNPGLYSCKVWVVNDANRSSTTNDVNFAIRGAFDDLKDEIEAASAGATITVKAGTYVAMSTITIPNKNISIVAADPANTIIDGGYPVLSNNVFSVSKEGVVISGITFQNTGKSAIAQSSSPYGLVISNCVFRNCRSGNGAAINGNLYYGEHDAQSDTVFPPRGAMGVISGCTFTNCVATQSSADGAGAVSGPFWIENSSFDACEASGCAPAVFTAQNTMITNCVFRNCPKGVRSAIYMNRKTTMKIQDCRFAGMTCSALFGDNGQGTTLVDRCDILNCSGEETLTSDSTAYAIFSSSGIARNSLIHGNKNPFNITGESYQNCTIVDNVGGLFIKFRNGGNGPSSSFTNCVFANNVKWPVYGKGGAGLQWHDSSLDANVYKNLAFCNCVLQGASDSESGLNVLLAQDPTGVSSNLTAVADAKGVGFRDAEAGNWTPTFGSVLRNGGILCDWMEGTLDLAGNPRVDGTNPDVGCYERPTRIGLQILVR